MGSLTETTLPVSGMSCASCVAKIEKALKGTDGVGSARVNLAAGRAAIAYDATRTGQTDLARTIEGLG